MRRFPSSWSETLSKLRLRRKRKHQGSSHRDYGRRQQLEPMEARAMLSVFIVESVDDGTLAGKGLITLRKANASANANSDPDQIQFAASLTCSGPAKISLLLAQLTISNDVTIRFSFRSRLSALLSRVFTSWPKAAQFSLHY
jgi:hypothetical protein